MARIVHTLDLNFQNNAEAIAAYLIPHSEGAVLVETGPGSTTDALQAGLKKYGYTVNDISHVLLTHIHLDHAGASGWLARQGVQICVHPRGAWHMMNPEKLIASATRIYKDEMDKLWGDFLAVPEDKLSIIEDGQEVSVGDLRMLAIHTPGHAEHHIAWGIENDIVFTGDIGGVRMPGRDYLRLPLVPPELHFEKWRASIEKLFAMNFKRVAPTHFSIFDDAEKHFQSEIAILEETSAWLDEIMQTEPSIEELDEKFTAWMLEQALARNINKKVSRTYALANPLHMAAMGLSRYWQKYRS